MSRGTLHAVALTAALLGCAAPGGGRTDAPARPQRETIQSFRLEGRILVRRAAQSLSASIAWQHAATADDIVVSAPLGQGLAHLAADASGAVLETTDHQRIEAPDLDALSARVFGAPLPVSGMADWVLGRPAQDGAAAVSARGWSIEYLEYESEAPDALPVLLRARREDIELRLKIDSWSLPQ